MGNSPAKVLLGRQLCTRLDLLKPNSAAQIESKQLNQKISHDNSVQPKQYAKGQSVLVGQHYKWTRGTILRSTGPVSYIVKLLNGDVTKINLKVVQNQKLICHMTYLILFLRICFQDLPALFHQNLLTPCLYNLQILKHQL